MTQTFYWHDYETFGADPMRDRPAQFAGLRTDLELNPIGKPNVIYCKPANDFLPNPEACLITGITPQIALKKGIREADFIAAIHTELAQAGTCTLGYNNLRFDDEVTRFCLYRNFYDPYAREWQNGNSRWDIIDMIRACYALRPDGIEWPRHPDGKPSFKLSDLSTANNIKHEHAHDALSDLYATIAMARLIKTQQSRLYDYLFNNRDKQTLAQQLNVVEQKPVLHTSSKYPSEYGCTSMIVPLSAHPYNRNSVIVYDLRYDPSDLIELSADEIRERLYTKTEDLPENAKRIPIKEIHLNKCPVVAPIKTLTEQARQQIQLDTNLCEKNLRTLLKTKNLANKIKDTYNNRDFPLISDPDLALYSGGFFSAEDRKIMQVIREATPENLSKLATPFEDTRLPEMLFRYRARNYPETLNRDEQERWEEYRIAKLTDPNESGNMTIDQYKQHLNALATSNEITPEKKNILKSLNEYISILSD